MITEQVKAPERRQFRRVAVSFLVIYKVNTPLIVRMEIGDKLIDAVALDLSVGGIAVLTNYDLPQTASVSVRFTILNETALRSQDRYRSIQVEGDVRYSVLTKDKAFRVGVRFFGLSQEEKSFIADFVRLTSLAQGFLGEV